MTMDKQTKHLLNSSSDDNNDKITYNEINFPMKYLMCLIVCLQNSIYNVQIPKFYKIQYTVTKVHFPKFYKFHLPFIVILNIHTYTYINFNFDLRYDPCEH